MNNFIDTDVKIFKFINHLPHYVWLDKIALSLDYLGRSYVIYGLLICLLLWVLLFKKKEYSKPLLLLCGMLLFTNFFAHSMKDWIARPRPYLVFKDAYLLGYASGGSMPSGHAATYGLISLFMIFYVKRYKIFWVGFMIFEGFCRVYQGVHYPSDVLASWFIAISVMCLFSILYKLFQKERQGYVKN